ncbi:unnamed protein product [Dovyalis caffra]|uniref:NADH dehydrogenase subunit 4L n=1 Tax=Dovyalis caffra TaxID=77055 RepID=A0AAV1SLS2_9ROSI|nr:unnamed protein product [Dovyalis caffra]
MESSGPFEMNLLLVEMLCNNIWNVNIVIGSVVYCHSSSALALIEMVVDSFTLMISAALQMFYGWCGGGWVGGCGVVVLCSNTISDATRSHNVGCRISCNAFSVLDMVWSDFQSFCQPSSSCR